MNLQLHKFKSSIGTFKSLLTNKANLISRTFIRTEGSEMRKNKHHDICTDSTKYLTQELHGWSWIPLPASLPHPLISLVSMAATSLRKIAQPVYLDFRILNTYPIITLRKKGLNGKIHSDITSQRRCRHCNIQNSHHILSSLPC